MDEEVTVAELAANFVRRVAANAFGAAVPIQDPALAIYNVNPSIELIEQFLAKLAIQQSLLHDGQGRSFRASCSQAEFIGEAK
jgi:hypothetical protein